MARINNETPPANSPPMNAPTSRRRPIGQILISQGVISEDQLRIALLEQMKSNQPVGKLLVSLGFVSEATLRDALGESLGQIGIFVIFIGVLLFRPQGLFGAKA